MAIYAHMVCRLTKDPELKSSGENEILNFSVATDHGYGEKKTTTFVNCSMWGNRGVKLKNFISKGNQVVVHGEIFTRKYQTKEGEERTSLECRVIELDLVGTKGNNAAAGNGGNSTTGASPASANHAADEDSIPF